MTQPVVWIFGMVLTLSSPVGEPGKCSLTATQPQVCVNSSLLINMHCQNDSQALWEWIEPNGQRAIWELTRPTKQVNSASESRYAMASELISVAPGHELNLTLPVTRWFSLSDPGAYSLQFHLHSASGSLQIESNKVAFTVKSCTDEAILAECRTFFKGQRENLEAVAGFDSAAAIPCMQEALSKNSEFMFGIIDGLARIHSPEAINILLKRFESGNAFDRLGVWQALHRIDTSKLSAELRKKVEETLKQQPVTIEQ